MSMDNKEQRKEELYSQAIPAGKRRYFFDVKETRGGDKFITITESRKLFDNNTGEVYFEKNKMFLYKEDFEKFAEGLEDAVAFIRAHLGQVENPGNGADDAPGKPFTDVHFDEF